MSRRLQSTKPSAFGRRIATAQTSRNSAGDAPHPIPTHDRHEDKQIAGTSNVCMTVGSECDPLLNFTQPRKRKKNSTAASRRNGATTQNRHGNWLPVPSRCRRGVQINMQDVETTKKLWTVRDRRAVQRCSDCDNCGRPPKFRRLQVLGLACLISPFST
jgi:hypothetical protein